MITSRRSALAVLMGLLLAAGAAGQAASTGAIIGLIGKSVNRTQRADAALSEALKSGTHYFPEIQEAFEKILATHLSVARDLRSAFALGQIPPGYDASAPVAGLSPDQVAALDPGGFYFTAINAHRQLNDRLAQVLEEWTTNLTSGDYTRYKQQLNQAEAIVTYPRAKDTSQAY